MWRPLVRHTEPRSPHSHALNNLPRAQMTIIPFRINWHRHLLCSCDSIQQLLLILLSLSLSLHSIQRNISQNRNFFSFYNFFCRYSFQFFLLYLPSSRLSFRNLFFLLTIISFLYIFFFLLLLSSHITLNNIYIYIYINIHL